MNIADACALLEVPIGASPDDVKKAFKQKAVKYHPDVNKDPNAESTFKQINEANQILETYGTTPLTSNVGSVFYNHSDHLEEELRRHMNDIFGVKFNVKPRKSIEPIIVNVEIPFETSILGGFKDISYERTVKCASCHQGKVKSNFTIVCQKCNGKGHRKYGDGSDDRELPCNTCKAKGHFDSEVDCSNCSGKGSSKVIHSLKVTIPPGVIHGAQLVLKEKGNWDISQNYGHVIVIVSVLPDSSMQRSGNDVIGIVELSLLEALTGTKKTLRTVKGDKTLAFKPKTKNKDTIKVAGFGVPPNGSHVFVINVTYPEDVSKIIEVLENTNKQEPEEISGVQD